MSHLWRIFVIVGALACNSNHVGLDEVLQSQVCLLDRDQLRQRRHLTAAVQTWVLEDNAWDSHRLVTAIAAILLRDQLGYDVRASASDAEHFASALDRVAGRWLGNAKHDGAIVHELRQGGVSFGYANMEHWHSARPVITNSAEDFDGVSNMGSLGYDGRDGWFIAETFAVDPTLPHSPEFFRSWASAPGSPYHVSGGAHDLLLEFSSVDCSAANVCRGATAACHGNESTRSLSWCPSSASERRASIWAEHPWLPGSRQLPQALAEAHDFRFSIQFLGDDFLQKAAETLASKTPALIQIMRPSRLFERLRDRGIRLRRVLLPTEDCGDLGAAEWSCDFPPQELLKLASRHVKDDIVVHQFLSAFTVPPRAQVAGNGEAHQAAAPLRGAGISELVAALNVNGSNNTATPTMIFDTACAWVRQNQATWMRWTDPVARRLQDTGKRPPIWADNLHPTYPWLTSFFMFVVAIVGILFLENPWLWTTLSPIEMKKMWNDRSHLHWRSPIEQKIRWYRALDKLDTGLEQDLPAQLDDSPAEGVSSSSRLSTPSREDSHMKPVGSMGTDIVDRYWEGLSDRVSRIPAAVAFWEAVEAWQLMAAAPGYTEDDNPPLTEDFVCFGHISFACVQSSKVMRVLVKRSEAGVASQTACTVEVCIEACNGGAKNGDDFEGGTQSVTFEKGQENVVINIPITHHTAIWKNSEWFRARLTRIKGEAACHVALGWPRECILLILNDGAFPSNIQERDRGGEGVNLMKFFFRHDRLRRGEKYWKCLLAMSWMPVHSVFVSTLVQQVMVDETIQAIKKSAVSGEYKIWFYYQMMILVFAQFVSMMLYRWADVVHTRNRGRTGGVRQPHRHNLLRKFMHLEHSEHWVASDGHWLYSIIYDADVITGSAYYQQFKISQAVVALTLSLFLIIFLGARNGNSYGAWYIVLIASIIPVGLITVFARRQFTWKMVLQRKLHESEWIRSATWIVTNWRQYFGLLWSERAALEARVQQQNSSFIPNHWAARDTMNDTSAVVDWLVEIVYIIVLVFGAFGVIEYEVYNAGDMTIGTYYAILKLALTTGKGMRDLSSALIDIQRAVVSLREIAGLLNQPGQRSQMYEAKLWQAALANKQALVVPAATGLKTSSRFKETSFINIEEGAAFIRPKDSKYGMTFREVKFASEMLIPLGKILHLRAKNEGVLATTLGLISGVIHVTGPKGEPYRDDWPGVRVAYGLHRMMIPMVHPGMGTTAPTVEDQLLFTGAPKQLCVALAEACGLAPKRETAALGLGHSQIFAIIKALLVDPDILCAVRPLAQVPADILEKMEMLLRLWQIGGMPAIAEKLGVANPTSPATQKSRSFNGNLSTATEGKDVTLYYRSPRRTLVLGDTSMELWKNAELWRNSSHADVFINIDDYLWKGEGPLRATTPGLELDPALSQGQAVADNYSAEQAPSHTENMVADSELSATMATL